MNVCERAQELLCAPYALRADGTVLSVDGREIGWSGVKKVSGRLALRWDGRVLTDGRWQERAEAIARWRKVKDVCCCHPIEAALLENGDLTWVRHEGVGQLRYGHTAAGWTDVESLVITRDPYDRERSYADYAVGFRADGTVRAAYLGGGEDRSREIEALLGSLGGVRKISQDCRALAADGTVYDFGTRRMGKKEAGRFADFDLPAKEGALEAWDGCLLLEDGGVRVPDGLYPKAAEPEWRDIVAISGTFLPIETGRHVLMALRADGQVLAAEKYGHEPVDTSGWKLFDSLDALPAQRESARQRCLEEGLQLDREEEEKARIRELKRLTEDRAYTRLAIERMKKELAQTRGLFSGGRRKKLEEDVAVQEKRLAEVEEELKKYE